MLRGVLFMTVGASSRHHPGECDVALWGAQQGYDVGVGGGGVRSARPIG